MGPPPHPHPHPQREEKEERERVREREREGGERERERTANLHQNVRLISILVFCDVILSNLHSARLFSRNVMII